MPVAQLPSQHFLPAPHWASLPQLQEVLLHWCVPWSQQLPAVQSASEWQQLSQAPLAQHFPAPQSPSEQHTPELHAPPQHTRPEPHCAELVQAQTLALHWCEPGSQHCPARQSPSDLQPGAQVPPLQNWAEPQSGSPQQLPAWHTPPQHLRPLPHWASLLHAQALDEQVCVPGSQHWPARQSPSEQQLPCTQVFRTPLPLVPVVEALVVPVVDPPPVVLAPELEVCELPAVLPWVELPAVVPDVLEPDLELHPMPTSAAQTHATIQRCVRKDSLPRTERPRASLHDPP